MEINKELKKEKKRILTEAFRKKILTKKEYEKDYKEKYIDQYGFDSFLNYLSYLIIWDKHGYFLTIGKPILKDRKKIEKRFGLKIIAPKDVEKMIK